mmetsp:Transcript_14612/g.19080  ORF Transcript_14612/g.19080 Transcript_14612/m.19080 type:complete len:81 (-) Transcript_14612:138-380(-)
MFHYHTRPGVRLDLFIIRVASYFFTRESFASGSRAQNTTTPVAVAVTGTFPCAVTHAVTDSAVTGAVPVTGTSSSSDGEG